MFQDVMKSEESRLLYNQMCHFRQVWYAMVSVVIFISLADHSLLITQMSQLAQAHLLPSYTVGKCLVCVFHVPYQSLSQVYPHILGQGRVGLATAEGKLLALQRAVKKAQMPLALLEELELALKLIRTQLKIHYS